MSHHGPFVHSSINEALDAAQTHHLLLGMVNVMEMHLVRLQNYARKSQLLRDPVDSDMIKEEHEMENTESKLLELIGQQNAIARRWAALIADAGASQPLSAALDPANYRLDDWPAWVIPPGDSDDDTDDTEDDPDYVEPEMVAHA